MVLDVEYSMPFLSHAAIESTNCTANVTSNSCEIWVPTQSQSICFDKILEITGLSEEDITIHTPYVGGGFGRRIEVDEVVQSFKSKVPSDVNFTYVMDSREIMEDNVNSLQGNILLATIFVIIVTMLALGIRSSLIVGSGIPVSILIALFVLYVLGYDYNFMVILN